MAARRILKFKEKEPAHMHLLFIDYDLNHLKVMQNVFELWGYQVTICSNKDQVIGHSDKKCFDAIITELSIPGTNPQEMIPFMRQKWANIPIIVLTENHSLKSAIRAMKDGADDILQRPIEPEQLRSLLAGLMNSTRQRGVFSS